MQMRSWGEGLDWVDHQRRCILLPTGMAVDTPDLRSYACH
jgi:hypothetical protein